MVRCCRDDVARDVEFSGYFRPKARSYETAVFQFRFCARDIRSTLIGFASVGDKQFNGDGGDRASLRDARRYYACLERDPRLRAAGGFGHHGPWCLSQSPCVPTVRLIPCHPRIALPALNRCHPRSAPIFQTRTTPRSDRPSRLTRGIRLVSRDPLGVGLFECEDVPTARAPVLRRLLFFALRTGKTSPT